MSEETLRLSPVDVTSKAISDIAAELHHASLSKKQRLCKHINYTFQHAKMKDCLECAQGACFLRTCLDCAKEY